MFGCRVGEDVSLQRYLGWEGDRLGKISIL
jgi:hypothetical protein